MAKFDPFLSLDCAGVEGVGAQSKERKGSNFAAQRSGAIAIVQKPEGPNTYDLKVWLSSSGFHIPERYFIGNVVVVVLVLNLFAKCQALRMICYAKIIVMGSVGRVYRWRWADPQKIVSLDRVAIIL